MFNPALLQVADSDNRYTLRGRGRARVPPTRKRPLRFEYRPSRPQRGALNEAQANLNSYSHSLVGQASSLPSRQPYFESA
jgi:hypothetical protein